MIILFALAAGLSLPPLNGAEARDVRTLFTANDFPPYLTEMGTMRTVYTRTTVRPDGTVEGCVAEVSSGDARLDAYTCRLIVKRSRFLPASWVDGSPAYAVIRAPVRWTISEGPLPQEELWRHEVPDLDLAVDRLPQGAHGIVPVDLVLGVDEGGKPSGCVEWAPLQSDKRQHFPELVQIACRQVISQLSLVPPIDSAGNRVRSVQTVFVHFNSEH